MAVKLRTSEKTEEIINRLGAVTKLPFNSLGRLALGLSLQEEEKPPRSTNTRGKEFNKYSLIGDYEPLYKGILGLRMEESLRDDEFFSNESLMKDHLDRGAKMMEMLYQELDQNVDEFLAKISELTPGGIEGFHTGKVLPLDIKIGEDIARNKPLIYGFNDTRSHNNPHLGIMGTTGVGKTQLLLSILYDIREQSNQQTNFIYFDYRGEFLNERGEFEDEAKRRFIEDTKTEILQVPQDQLPINPFVLNKYDDKSIAMSAEEKADSFALIESRFGPVQKGNLSRAIKEAYQKHSSADLPYPDLKEVYTVIQNMYERDDKKPDTLTETMRRLAEFELFWEHSSGLEIIRKLTNRSLVIDLSNLNVLKELVVFLVIEQLYREMNALPEARVEDGYRELRTVLVIDEAHHYLPKRNKFLQLILREGRGKGLAVFLASQSPSDYDQKFFDFKELLEFPIIFQSKGLKKKSFQNLLGCSPKSAGDLIQIVPKLDPFNAISRPFNPEKDYRRFVAEALFKRFSF